MCKAKSGLYEFFISPIKVLKKVGNNFRKFTWPDNNKKFLEDLLEYYINESSSYIQIAEEYSDITDSKNDTAFGIIVGIVYSSFLQIYSNQGINVELEDMQEFYELVKANASKIKESLEPKKA